MKRRMQQTEGGFTLVELLIASTMLVIVMLIALQMVGMTETSYHDGLVRGESQSQVLVAMGGVTQTMRGGVTPIFAANANGAKPAATSPCWGTTRTPDNSKTQGSAATGAITKPTATAIIWAHPFDLRMCAVVSPKTGAATPDVVRIWIDPSTCKGASPNSYCTLLVDSYGPTGTSAPVAVQRWKDVWCTATCQKDNTPPVSGAWPTKVGSTPALFTYYPKTGTSSPAISQPIDDLSKTNSAHLTTITEIVTSITVLVSPNPAANSTLRIEERTQVWLQNITAQRTG